MDNAKMGELIRDSRKEKGLTQKDVADKLGITDRAVSKWERGICAPDIAYIEELAEMLGLTVAELIAGGKFSFENTVGELLDEDDINASRTVAQLFENYTDKVNAYYLQAFSSSLC